jgi:hypothetical protein
MRIVAIVVLAFNVGVVLASDVDATRMMGTWSVSELEPKARTNQSAARVADPMVISERQISWASNDHRQCVAGYRIASRAVGPIFPGGPIDNRNAADAYTIFKLELEQPACDQRIAFFTVSFASGATDIGHFAVFGSDGAVQSYGAIYRESPERQVTAEAVPFTPEEIAIYRDFLLHYPDQTSNMIGMQDTTVAFDAPLAFGYESDPPDVVTPSYRGRKLPSELMALTDEAAVTARIAAAGKLIDAKELSAYQGPDGYVRTHLTLSEIAFDSKHEIAVLVFTAHCSGKCGSRGTVVYKLQDGRWIRTEPILNFWIG